MFSIFSLDYGLFYFFTYFTYFTSFPQNLFIQAKKNSNFTLTGIGLELINNQYVFWISNASLIWFQYNQQYHYLYSKINYFYLLYSSIQIFLIYKTAYLFKLLKKS